MAETESTAKPDGTLLASKVGGKPTKVGDLVTFKGAGWRVEDDGPTLTHNRASVRLKGLASPVPVRSLARREPEPKPAPKAATTAKAKTATASVAVKP